MPQLFFRKEGEVVFVRISPKTADAITLHRQQHKVTTQEIIDRVRTAHGSVSEKTILRYLDDTTLLE
ncbi:MAG: hypothetical protein IT406_03115 [Candidatus Yanofskybacteria bacterium]|nr:hypothetical protein [Candidatus Yanofskybacteria bacterium]